MANAKDKVLRDKLIAIINSNGKSYFNTKIVRYCDKLNVDKTVDEIINLIKT